MAKNTLREKLNGNEMDLSLSDLTVVPVKELAAIPKATQLDLSCNQISSLPESFCTLTHLVKLDLSKNQLTALPEDFGELTSLQYIDLFQNKLTDLPVSFWRLKNLKWLDLKTNPLKTELKSVVGDCLDDSQCKACAKQVVMHMKALNSEQERRRQKELQLKREEESQLKLEEEKQRKLKKAQKASEKERRRKIFLEEQANKKKLELTDDDIDGGPDNDMLAEEDNDVEKKPTEKTGLSCIGVLMASLFGLMSILIGVYFYCETQAYADPVCKEGRTFALHHYNTISHIMLDYYNKTKELMS